MIELAKRRQSQYAKQIEFCVADATDRKSIYIFIFLGNALGTWLLALLERPDGSPYIFLGLDFYAPQIITAIKVAGLIGCMLYIWMVAPRLETVRR